nr:alpha/beta hydrolase [uncultured Cohaesibacter sp.]
MEKFNAHKGQIQRDGYTLGYRIEGHGAPLLIIGSHVFYPRTFSANLRTKRKLIFVDHRGFSPVNRAIHTRDCALGTIMDDLSALCQTLGLAQTDILGHSGHGYMALEFARRCPERVRKTVLVGTGPNQDPETMAHGERIWAMLAAPDRKKRLEQDLEWMTRQIEAEPEKRFIWMCLGMGARSWFDPHFDARDLWQDVHVNMPIFDHLWGETFRDYDTHKALSEMKSPLLICMGRHDHLVAPVETWFPYLPEKNQPVFALFEYSAHTPQLEEADRFDDTILTFLS